MIRVQDNPALKVFTADAMNTTFTIRILHENRKLSEEAAGACFTQLEILENLLSRYRHDSDVSRINEMKDGDSLYISDQTHACLLRAMEATVATAGLFDVSLGAHTQKDSEQDPSKVNRGQLEISPDRPLVQCHEAGRQIDLGGIGKGYALDQLATILNQYGIQSAILASGASTHLALGNDVWPVELTGDKETVRFSLRGAALSASGIGLQGEHIIHPDSLSAPDYEFKRVWITMPTATQADAFSTACLLMNVTEAKNFAEAVEILSLHVERTSTQKIDSWVLSSS